VLPFLSENTCYIVSRMRTNPNSGPRIRIGLFYSTQCNRYFHLKIGVLSAPKTQSVHFRTLNDG
jgi:hypothetical protein